ncbi:ecotin [Novymonas esmeraldas]|uniref:Ecotin n=1 Tax=Novymonas esmeraldas TaxID=1808958 RepID=A0AAW0F002_9TRYP
MPKLEDYHAPYPAPAPGQERKVIYLPPHDAAAEQQHLRVQLIPGRHEDCEDGRLYQLTGTVVEETVQGWGYSYYVVTMGDVYVAHRHTPSDPENATTFVALHESPILPYNSKLPIVVYVPEGAEVRYRIWSDGTAPAPVEQHHEQQPHASRAALEHEYPEEHEQPRGGAIAAEYTAEPTEAPRLSAHEDHRHEREAPALAQESYAQDATDAPALRSAEAEQPHAQPAMVQSETYPEDNAGAPREHVQTSERRRSSSRPRKHSADPSSPNRTHLSSTEKSPKANAKSEQPRRSLETSAVSDTAGSTKKHRSGSGAGRKESGAGEDGYDQKAKNFWNRARSDSTPKRAPSASPKKANGTGGASKPDPWAEM